MRIALVGFGRWGKNHARVLQDEGWLAAIVDSNATQLALCRQLYPAVDTFRDISDLPWSELDALVLASPIECHVSQGLVSIEKGKHCLIEKPLALSVSESNELAAAASTADVVVMTGHILDYHPAARQLISMCSQGELGDLRYWHSSRARLVPPRRYASVVHELLWHDLSLLFRITGRLPGRVTVHGQLEDDGVLGLEYGDFYATLSGSQVQPLRESRVVICGTTKSLVFDDEQPCASKLQICDTSGSAEYIPVLAVEPLRAELQHFVEAIRGKQQPFTTIVQVVEILELIEMIEETCEVCLRF